MRLVFQSKGMWNVRDVEDAQGRELGTELDSSILCFFYLFSEFVDSFVAKLMMIILKSEKKLCYCSFS